MKRPIKPFTPEAYDSPEYNEANDYTRSDYEQYAPFDVDDYDDWKEEAGLPDERE